MNEDTTKGLKGGVLYDDLHVQAHKIAIDGLLELGILKGNADEIFAARTSTAFFPHGLGHHLGMDCHDTGGNPNRADKDKLFPNLRLRGTVPAGSIVTIEPGVSNYSFPDSMTYAYKTVRSTSASSSSSPSFRILSTASSSMPLFLTSTGPSAASAWRTTFSSPRTALST